jgi:hypothetical protein
MISVGEDVIELGAPRRPLLWIGWREIRKITMYKRDEFTTDLICCDIEFERFGVRRTYFVHEEVEGWNELVEAFADRLPGFFKDWWGVVAKPAFEPNITVVYVHQEKVY